MVKTCNTRETHVIIRVPAVIKTWGDAVRRERLGVCLGQSTVIGRVLRVGITVNSVCLAAYHWQMDFSVNKQCLGSAQAVLRQCFSSGTAADGHTPYKARPSQNWPKITTYDHVHQIFITSCTWFRRGVLSDRGFSLNARGSTNLTAVFHWPECHEQTWDQSTSWSVNSLRPSEAYMHR